MQAGGNGPHSGEASFACLLFGSVVDSQPLLACAGPRDDFMMLASGSTHAIAGLTTTEPSGAVITTHPLAIDGAQLDVRCSCETGQRVRLELVLTGATSVYESAAAASGSIECPETPADGVVTGRLAEWEDGGAALAQMQSEMEGEAALRFHLPAGATLFSAAFV